MRVLYCSHSWSIGKNSRNSSTMSQHPEVIPCHVPRPSGKFIKNEKDFMAALRMLYTSMSVLGTKSRPQLKSTYLEMTKEEIRDRCGSVGLDENLIPGPGVFGFYLFTSKIMLYQAPNVCLELPECDSDSPPQREAGEVSEFPDERKNAIICATARAILQDKNREDDGEHRVLGALTIIVEYFNKVLCAMVQKACAASLLSHTIQTWLLDISGLDRMVADLYSHEITYSESRVFSDHTLSGRKHVQRVAEIYLSAGREEFVEQFNKYLAADSHPIKFVEFSWNNFVCTRPNYYLLHEMSFSAEALVIELFWKHPELKTESDCLDECVRKIRDFQRGSSEQLQINAARHKDDLNILLGEARDCLQDSIPGIARGRMLIKCLEIALIEADYLQIRGGALVREHFGNFPDRALTLVTNLRVHINMAERKKAEFFQRLLQAIPASSGNESPGPGAGSGSRPSVSVPRDNTVVSVVANIPTLTVQQAKRQWLAVHCPAHSVHLGSAQLLNRVNSCFLKDILNPDTLYYISRYKLRNLPPCLEDADTVVRNSESFLLTLKLFQVNGLEDKICPTLRGELLDKLFVSGQRHALLLNLARHEIYWKSLFYRRNYTPSDPNSPVRFMGAGDCPTAIVVDPEGYVNDTDLPIPPSIPDAGEHGGAADRNVTEGELENNRRELFLYTHILFYERTIRMIHAESLIGGDW